MTCLPRLTVLTVPVLPSFPRGLRPVVLGSGCPLWGLSGCLPQVPSPRCSGRPFPTRLDLGFPGSHTSSSLACFLGQARRAPVLPVESVCVVRFPRPVSLLSSSWVICLSSEPQLGHGFPLGSGRHRLPASRWRVGAEPPAAWAVYDLPFLCGWTPLDR